MHAPQLIVNKMAPEQAISFLVSSCGCLLVLGEALMGPSRTHISKLVRQLTVFAKRLIMMLDLQHAARSGNLGLLPSLMSERERLQSEAQALNAQQTALKAQNRRLAIDKAAAQSENASLRDRLQDLEATMARTGGIVRDPSDRSTGPIRLVSCPYTSPKAEAPLKLKHQHVRSILAHFETLSSCAGGMSIGQ